MSEEKFYAPSKDGKVAEIDLQKHWAKQFIDAVLEKSQALTNDAYLVTHEYDPDIIPSMVDPKVPYKASLKFGFSVVGSGASYLSAGTVTALQILRCAAGVEKFEHLSKNHLVNTTAGGNARSSSPGSFSIKLAEIPDMIERIKSFDPAMHP